jgi:pyruvate decarboxylase
MVLLSIVIYTCKHFVFVFSFLKGRPVYIGLALDLSGYEINVDPSTIKPLNLSIPRNPKDEHQAVLETVIDLAKKAQNIVVIVDA